MAGNEQTQAALKRNTHYQLELLSTELLNSSVGSQGHITGTTMPCFLPAGVEAVRWACSVEITLKLRI